MATLGNDIDKPFARHAEIADTTRRVPEAATKILVLMPMHAYAVQASGSSGAKRMQQCASGLADIAAHVSNARFVNAYGASPLAQDDRHCIGNLRMRRP